MEGKGLDPDTQLMGNQKKTRLTKRMRGVIACGVVLILGGIAWAIYINNRPSKTINDQCSNRTVRSTVYKDINLVLQNKKPDELKIIIDQVQKIPSYEKDQNCLYPIVKYYLLIGDSRKSRELYDMYVKAYISDESYLKIFGPNLENPVTLKPQVEVLERQRSAAEKNSFYGPEVAP